MIVIIMMTVFVTLVVKVDINKGDKAKDGVDDNACGKKWLFGLKKSVKKVDEG